MKFLEKILSSGLYLLAFLLSLQTRLFIRPGVLNGGYWEYGTISLYGTDILLVILLILFLFSPSPRQERAGVRLVAWCNKAIGNLLSYFNSRNSTSSLRLRSGQACPSPGQEKGLGGKAFVAKRNVGLLIVGLNLISLISIFFSADHLVAVQAYIRLTLGMGLFFLISSAAFDQAKLLYAFLAGAAFQATLGIWQFLSQATFANKWLGLAAHPAEVGGNSVIETISGGRWLRAYGGLDHPNVLGGLMTISILLIIYLMLRNDEDKKIFNFQISISNKIQNPKSKMNSIIFYLLYFIDLTALFFTFSRGAWVGLAVGFIVILAFNFRTQNWQGIRKLIILGAGSIVLAGVLFLNFQDLVATRFSGSTRLEIKSNQERAASYKDGLAIIKKHWFSGVGIGNYTYSLVQRQPGQPSWFYQPTHNVFLLVWAETGIVGIILYLGIFVILIISNFPASRRFFASRGGQFPISNRILNEKNLNDKKLFIRPWEFIRNWILGIRNYTGLKITNKGIIINSIILAMITMMSVDHYLWSLHFGVLFFWFILGLVVKIDRWTDLTNTT